ncbi:MAG: hypothetical protein O6929_14430, partial [candidate division NC10 bacterium]|nr:hypothetical protein [candidate division NC10 bacterium]
GLLHGLKDLGVKGLTKPITSDELDAVTAALVGRWFLQGKGEMLGGDEGILIPKSRRRHVSLKGEKRIESAAPILMVIVIRGAILQPGKDVVTACREFMQEVERCNAKE